MSLPAGVRGVVDEGEIRGEDPEETIELIRMCGEAKAYLRSFDWCTGIENTFFGGGVGEVVGVFLFELAPAPEIDRWLWVVNGDLPSAYLVLDQASTPRAAVTVYCELMQEWIDAVLAGRSLDDVYPVRAVPTREHAHMLQKRLDLLRNEIIPALWPE